MRTLTIACLVALIGCKHEHTSTSDATPPVPDASAADASAPDASAADATGPDAPPPDAALDGGATSCDPVAQTGCDVGQKCTWIRLQASPSEELGQLGCVPDGTKAHDGACTWGPAGVSTGYDDCAKGMICLASPRTDQASGTCEVICDSLAAAGAFGSCAQGYACGTYAAFFENPGGPQTSTGLCDHACDPLSNERDDGVPNCNGTLVNGVSTRGCYGLPSLDTRPSMFTCGADLHPTYTSDVLAYDAQAGGLFVNSCAPGYLPLLYADTASTGDKTKVICVATCQAGPTSKEAPANAAGLVGSAYTCPAKGAGGSHECRYWSFLEGAMTPVGPHTASLGFCMDYTKYLYPSKPNGAPDTPYPSCTVLSSTAHTWSATETDDVVWGCAPRP